ncbi:hypothetical protein [Streptomyces sp. NPDC056817]|uniref:hypothetical protein n=1 Tax=Streptomyces sp. NPDC056817 TaxID=3345950 RepID=UPI0036A0A1A7
MIKKRWARAALSHPAFTGIFRTHLGGLIEELAPRWQARRESALRERRHGATSDAGASVPQQSGPSAALNPVNASVDAEAHPLVLNPVKTPDQTPEGAGGVDSVAPGEEYSAPQADAQPRQLPYDDAAFVVMHLQLKMEPAVFAQCARMMMGALQNNSPTSTAL